MSLLKKYKTLRGVIVKCQSGRFLAISEEYPEISADGDTENEAIKNVVATIKVVQEYKMKQTVRAVTEGMETSITKPFERKVLCV